MPTAPLARILCAAALAAAVPATAATWSRIDIQSKSNFVIKKDTFASGTLKVRKVGEPEKGVKALMGPYLLEAGQSYLFTYSGNAFKFVISNATANGKAASNLPTLQVGYDPSAGTTAVFGVTKDKKGREVDFTSSALVPSKLDSYKEGSKAPAFLTIGVLKALKAGAAAPAADPAPADPAPADAAAQADGAASD
ncbi:hypothetical protein [Mesoterricola sediminis]|uniref:Uncharacterized protein n=1 Tax=Mesoterricola sediminis TaxID=2927980 RepID=A0AA48KBF1_9BACT|nr:hypothetical protein [Mesoterricola sediminis]BDU75756.1 hypothetical protein METESE_07140 [Mesoterricola sediminis]